MNFANLNDGSPEPSTGSTGSDGQGGGEELNDALAEPEAEFAAAEKKPLNQSVLMLLGIIIIGAAGMYVMHQRTGPTAAKAASDTNTATAEAAIANFMKGGSGNIALLRRLLEDTARIVEQFKIYPNVAQVPLSDLHSNPFHLASAKPPPGEDPEEIARKKKEEERAAALKAVQALSLQTVIVRGNRKACMINNTLYQEGETVDIFTVDKINANGVIVKSGSFRFELKMAK